MTSPQRASSGSPADAEHGDGGTAPTTGLDDAAEEAGKSIGTGVATGTGDIAGGIDDYAPITAGTLQKTGQTSAEAVNAAAKVVADAIRVLPLEDLQDTGG